MEWMIASDSSCEIRTLPDTAPGVQFALVPFKIRFGGAVPGNDGTVLPAARHDERIPRVLPRHRQHADDFAGHADPDQPACGDDLHFGAADGNVWHCLCLRHRLVRDANGGSSILLLAKSAK